MSKIGDQNLESGTPDVVLFNLLLSNQKNGKPSIQTEIDMDQGLLKIAMGKLAKNKFISVDKKSKNIILSEEALNKATELSVDTTQDLLKLIKSNAEQYDNTEIDQSKLDELKKAKLITTSTTKVCKISKGEAYSLEQKTDNTTNELNHNMVAKMLKGEEFTFKPLNLKAKGKRPHMGTLHNVTKVRNNMKQILLEMGFEEMPTNKWVESSFWNFDSLFQPQQHPARDAHDTFFMKHPLRCDKIDAD